MSEACSRCKALALDPARFASLFLSQKPILDCGLPKNGLGKFLYWIAGYRKMDFENFYIGLRATEKWT
jgi:hypothetical protein